MEEVACVASVSVGFQSKKSLKNGIFEVLAARKMGLKLRKSLSLDFFCSETPRKRLLRRLVAEEGNMTPLKTTAWEAISERASL